MSFPEHTYHLSFKKMSRFILFMSNRSKLPPLFLPPPHTVTPSTNLISLLNQDMEETDSNSLLSEDISNHIVQLLWRASSAQGSYEPVTFSVTLVENALLHKNKQTNQDALEQQKQNMSDSSSRCSGPSQEGNIVRYQFQSQRQSLLLHFIPCLLQVKYIYRYEYTLCLPYKQRIHSVFILYSFSV